MHRHMACLRSLLLATLALQVGHPLVWAEEPSPERSAGMVAIQLEVSVDGQPLRGLTAEDFHVRDKGREALVVEAAEVDHRQLLFLFDLEFTTLEQTVRAVELALELVSESLPASDRVAIVTHAPSTGLGLLLAPTAERSKISAALGTLREQQQGRPSSSTTGPVVSADDLITARARNLESEKGIVQREQGRILGLVRSLAKLDRVARSVPGGSQVILFSRGFDSSVVLGNVGTQRLDQAWSTEQSEAAARGELWSVGDASRYGGGFVETELFEVLANYSRLGVPIQAVRLQPEGDARRVERGAQGPNGLVLMAEKTGGQVFVDSGDRVAEMSKALTPQGSAYLLTFKPRGLKSAGRYRRLDVTLENPVEGASLIVPPGYYEPESSK